MEKNIINNAYIDLDILYKNSQFKFTYSTVNRKGIYVNVQRYKKWLKSNYDSGLCLKITWCIFTLLKGKNRKIQNDP